MQLSFALLAVLLPALASAHGYLCKPPPRGIEKEATNIDALKSPNVSGKVCRGEGPGQITTVEPGASITLEFTITAPHIGPCEVYLLDLDLDLSKQVKIAEKYDCAAPGKVEPWTVTLPGNVQGRKVLRWYWEGRHISTPGEPYEQCIDLQIGRGGLTIVKSNRRPMPPPRPVRPPPRRVPAPVHEAAPAHEEEQADGEDEPVHAQAASYDDAEPAYDDSDSTYQEAEEEPAYDDATDSDYAGDESAQGQEDCQQGQYVCNDEGGFSVCNNNSWVRQACGAGQVCAPSNGSILCVMASEASDY